MKHSWPVKCGCGQAINLEAAGTKDFPSVQCPKCGNTIVPIADALVHKRIFNRGYMELQDGDFTLAIVFAAMAVECYVAYLYLKWKGIDHGLSGQSVSSAEEDSWADDLRKWNSVGARFDKVCDLLTNQTFDSFLASTVEVAQKYPAMQAVPSAKQWFQDELFAKRNLVVHRGAIDFQQQEASACVEIARTLLGVFEKMDGVRYRKTFGSS